MTARSVLASALLGEDPPELPVSHLVHLAGLFGINENRARVALSRMVAAGEVTHRRDRPLPAGRPPARAPGPPGRQPARARPAPGTGRWRMVVVTGPGRSADERAARRRRLALARLAEQREGVWLRPDNLDLRPDPADDPDVALFTGHPGRRPGGAGRSPLGPRRLDGPGGATARRRWTPWPRRARRPGPGVRAVGRRAPPPAGRPPPAPSRFCRPMARAVPRGQYDHWDRRYRRVLRAGAGRREPGCHCRAHGRRCRP